MGKVIRIDDEVYAELQVRAAAFVDTPNDVLRRLLGISETPAQDRSETTIARGTTVRSKPELIRLLEDWLESSERVVGEAGDYGGKAWLYVDLGLERLTINADTNREGVERFIGNQVEDSTRWYVIANTRGIANKVTNDPTKRPIKGFFMYADRPGEREM